MSIHQSNISVIPILIDVHDSAGIICVGGDGIVNEVINGLSSRDDVEAACTIPIGIIPAGSDNSLVWTVLGIRDPIAAALMIVKVKKKTCINHPSYQSQPLQ